jgi:DASH complex subunit DAD2
MSHPPTRHSILPSGTGASTQSSLQARINAKRTELTHLQSLRDLSATLASQMVELEQKLGTLNNGAEAVSEVMRNWEGVLGVIGMAGREGLRLGEMKAEKENGEAQGEGDLPVTLVRIPVERSEGEEGGRVRTVS